MSSEPDGAGRAAALRDLLAARGLLVGVEEDGALAVLVPPPGQPIDWPAVRTEVVRVARELGFSHVAVELR